MPREDDKRGTADTETAQDVVAAQRALREEGEVCVCGIVVLDADRLCPERDCLYTRCRWLPV